MLSLLANGGHGCISVTANVAPRQCADMHLAWQAGKHDEALQTLARIDAAKQTGSWGATTYAIQGDLLTAVGRKSEARGAYQKALAKPGLSKAWREAIEKKIR